MNTLTEVLAVLAAGGIGFLVGYVLAIRESDKQKKQVEDLNFKIMISKDED